MQDRVCQFNELSFLSCISCGYVDILQSMHQPSEGALRIHAWIPLGTMYVYSCSIEDEEFSPINEDDTLELTEIESPSSVRRLVPFSDLWDP